MTKEGERGIPGKGVMKKDKREEKEEEKGKKGQDKEKAKERVVLCSICELVIRISQRCRI